MRIGLIFSVAAAIAVAPAHGQENKKQFPFWPWVQAGSYSPPNAIHMTMWINMETMHRAGDGILEVWFKYDNDRADQDGTVESLLYERIDCSRDWHSTISLLKYNDRSQVVYSSKAKRDDMEPIIPDSLLAGMMPFTCGAGAMPH